MLLLLICSTDEHKSQTLMTRECMQCSSRPEITSVHMLLLCEVADVCQWSCQNKRAQSATPPKFRAKRLPCCLEKQRACSDCIGPGRAAHSASQIRHQAERRCVPTKEKWKKESFCPHKCSTIRKTKTQLYKSQVIVSSLKDTNKTTTALMEAAVGLQIHPLLSNTGVHFPFLGLVSLLVHW